MILKLKTLNEELYLNESIEDVYNQYYSASIPDRTEFDRVIALDPTFKVEQDRLGTYGKWLLNIYSKGEKFENSRITDLLTIYNENKNTLKGDYAQYKDIFKFKSVESLEKLLIELNFAEEQTDIEKGLRIAGEYQNAKRIYNDSDWEVWIPYSYKASVIINHEGGALWNSEERRWNVSKSDHPKWCTAWIGNYGSEYITYWRDYTEYRGYELLMFMNKHDIKKDYQFAIDKNSGVVKEYANYDDDVNIISNCTTFIKDIFGGVEKFKSVDDRLKTTDAIVVVDKVASIESSGVLEFTNDDCDTVRNMSRRNRNEILKVILNSKFNKAILYGDCLEALNDSVEFLNSRYFVMPSLKTLELHEIEGSHSFDISNKVFLEKIIFAEDCTAKDLDTVRINIDKCPNLKEIYLSNSIERLSKYFICNDSSINDKYIDLKIYTSSPKIYVNGEVAPFYKSHLVRLHNKESDVSSENTDTKEIAEEGLNESLDSSAPSWLRDLIKRHESSSLDILKDYRVYDDEKYGWKRLDLNKLKLHDYSIPSSGRDAMFRDTEHIYILHIDNGHEGDDDFICFYPNGEVRANWDNFNHHEIRFPVYTRLDGSRAYEWRNLNALSRQQLLSIVKHICYFDAKDASNYVSYELLHNREKSQENTINRQKGQIHLKTGDYKVNDVYPINSEEIIHIEDMWKNIEGLDKSGYFKNSDALLSRLIKFKSKHPDKSFTVLEKLIKENKDILISIIKNNTSLNNKGNDIHFDDRTGNLSRYASNLEELLSAYTSMVSTFNDYKNALKEKRYTKQQFEEKVEYLFEREYARLRNEARALKNRMLKSDNDNYEIELENLEEDTNLNKNEVLFL